MARQYISYRRVSTQKQGQSGLGLESQETLIRGMLPYLGGGEIVADYCEVYTGTDLRGCKELQKAIKHAKDLGGVLIIARTDRFRNTVEALQIYEEMGEGNIVFCDVPHPDKFSITMAFAFAEREALMRSITTKAAFAAKAARGETWVRNTDTSAARAVSCKMRTDARLEWLNTSPVCKYIRAKYEQGMSFPDMVEDLAKMYEIAPEIYCTRTGVAFTKGSLWKVWAWCREQSEPSELSERDRRNGGR